MPLTCQRCLIWFVGSLRLFWHYLLRPDVLWRIIPRQPHLLYWWQSFHLINVLPSSVVLSVQLNVFFGLLHMREMLWKGQRRRRRPKHNSPLINLFIKASVVVGIHHQFPRYNLQHQSSGIKLRANLPWKEDPHIFLYVKLDPNDQKVITFFIRVDYICSIDC